MEAFLLKVLEQFVSGFELTQAVLTWALNNPVAAAFWGAVWVFILDRFFAWTPAKWDDTIWNVLKQAITNGLAKIRGKP